MEDTTQPPPPQQQQETELAGDKRKREEESPAAATGDAEAAATSSAASTVEEVAAPAGDKRRREDSPEKPTGDEPEAASPAEEASIPAPAPAGGDRQLHPMSKTSLCSFFRRRGASPDGCSHGEGCRYAHTEEELRPRPDGTWDPTSYRTKKLQKVSDEEAYEEEVTIDETSLDKCLVGLSMHWVTDRLKSFLQEQGISYAAAKKKKGMTVGLTFENIEQPTNAVEVLKENRSGGKEMKIVDAKRRSHQKLRTEGTTSGNGAATKNSIAADGTSGPEAAIASIRTARAQLPHLSI